MKTAGMSRDLLGKIVDEVFDGAIEDTSVIEEIYDAIKRHEARPGASEVPGEEETVTLTKRQMDGLLRAAYPFSTADERKSIETSALTASTEETGQCSISGK